MKQTLPWNVTGIPPEARDVARAAATREGVSVGDWLTRRILAENARGLGTGETRSDAPPAPTYRYEREDETRRDRDDLTLRLARSEAEADSAFRRIDEALRTMARRLETNERSQNEAQRAMSTAASEISAATRDQPEAFVLLTQRIDRVEQNSDTVVLRDAVRGLHQGLSRLTEQIVGMASESSEQIEKLADNLDTLAGELASAREESIRVERSLDEGLNGFSLRLKDAEEKNGTDARLEETVGMLESRIASAEGRLQQALAQHLAVIERNLEGIAKKLDLAERSGEEAQNQMRENLRHLGQRIDAAEKRSKDTASEAKSGLSHAVKRIERLEATTQSGGETAASAPALPSEADSDEQDVNGAESFEADEAAPLAKANPPKPTVQDYLAQTRRAADAGGVDPLANRSAAIATARNRKILLAEVLLVLFVLSAGFFLMRMFGPRFDAEAPPAGVPRVTSEAAPADDPSRRLKFPASAGSLAAAVPAGTNGSLSPALLRLQAKADAGDIQAELLLGLKYADGDGVAPNDGEAVRWLQKAAQAGLAMAQYRLATLYEKGRGVPADAKQANSWYEEAAKRGNRKAMHNLAIAYANGAGQEKNFAEAARWFRAAAERGLADSQFNLAVLYERGLGVRASLADAYKWYVIAAAEGDAESKSRVTALATQIPPAEREAANQAAGEFKLTPMNREANEAPDLAQIAP
jgi:localization factor PodJL